MTAAPRPWSKEAPREELRTCGVRGPCAHDSRSSLMRLAAAAWCLLLGAGFVQGEAERLERLGSRGLRLHDPSTIIRSGKDYWVFHTGRGVGSARSTDLQEWEPGPAVFREPPAWAEEAVPENRRMHYWAPDIIRLGDRYFLYYSVSSFGRNTSVIALATNRTLDPEAPEYGWTDEGIVIRSSPAENFNAIDPALFLDRDGSLWMPFGSFWSGIRMIQLDPETGRRIDPDSTVYALAYNETIEAPYLHRRNDHYYLFVNWGHCCRGTNSTYEIRVGRSDSVTGPYGDRQGRDMLQAGGTLFLETDGPMIGPGHAGIWRESEDYLFTFHFYDATRGGASTYAIRPMRWRDDGWPEIMPAE